MANFDTRLVCEIVGITPTQVHYWDKTGIIKPSVVPASGSGSRRLYSFVDLVQFKVAKSLKDAGLSLQKIRKSLRWLGANYPDIKHPLATVKFLTDGETIFKVSGNRNIIIDTLNSGQIVHSIALGKLMQELRDKAKTRNMLKIRHSLGGLKVRSCHRQIRHAIGRPAVMAGCSGEHSLGGKWKEKVTHKGKEYTVLVEPDLDDGGYVVECLNIPGCFSQGDTRDEAIENITDAIKECQAVLRKKESRAARAHHG